MGPVTPYPGFALLGHPADFDHLAEMLLRLRPGWTRARLAAHRASLSRVLRWTAVHAAREALTVPCPRGGSLAGRLIVCTFLPQDIRSPADMLAAHHKTRDACRLARDLGAGIVGLGGFTSIVGGTQGEALAQEFGIAVTSGNSLTAALALAQLDALLDRLGWDLAGRAAAVLGAGGDIGRAIALALAPRVRRLTLVGRNRARLESLRDELPPALDVGTRTEPGAALDASLIVAAASAAQPVLAESDLRSGTLVCDIGYPPNLSLAADPRPDVLIFGGGLAQAPFDLGIAKYTRLPSPDLLHGCFAETIVLAMAGRYESFSVGQGRITIEKMRTALDLARSAGFRPAAPYRGWAAMDDAMVESFRRSSPA